MELLKKYLRKIYFLIKLEAKTCLEGKQTLFRLLCVDLLVLSIILYFIHINLVRFVSFLQNIGTPVFITNALIAVIIAIMLVYYIFILSMILGVSQEY